MDDAALRTFCAAHCEIQRVEERGQPERRRIAKGAAVCRDVIKRRMVADGVEVVPVMCGEKQMYAHLRAARAKGAAPAITADLVMDAVREMDFSVSAQGRATLADWVEACVVAKMRGKGDAEGDAEGCGADLEARTLVISAKPPADVDLAAHVHPLTRTHVQETATVWAANRDAARKEKRARDAALRELRGTIKQTEAAVAEHLLQHDPAAATRRVRVVSGDEEATLYLRRRATTRRKRPTERTALPALKRVVRTMCARAGHEGPPTWEAYRWLMQERTRETLRAQVAEALAELSASSERVGVVLDRV